MQKINIEKDEAVADIIERILETEAEEVVLVVPKRSRLIESQNNFKLLAREGKALGKSINIESVDEKVLEFAKASGLSSVHPLFDHGRAEAVSDILPREAETPRKGRGGAVTLKVPKDEAEEEEAEEEDEDAEDADEEKQEEDIDYRKAAADEEEDETPDPVAAERYDTIRSSRMPRWVWLAIGILVFLGLGMWGVNAAFGKATINIAFKKTPWHHEQTVVGATAVKSLDVGRGIVPVQLFEQQVSVPKSFPASGRAEVSEKAKGTITVVNAYSSEPQQLVATTRFEAPGGKIYRIDSAIVVPGAKIENGKVIPSSIKTPVTADGAGPSYNTGRVEKLTIPGFANTPKFEGFYGVLEDGASGGFTGEKAVATDADAAKAETEVRELIKETFRTTFLGGIPSDIKMLDEGRAMEVLKVTVNRSTDPNGNFSVSATAVFRAFGFREGDLTALLDAKAKESNADRAVRDVTLKYSNVTPDFGKKELRFTITADGSTVPAFDPEDFETKVRGEKEDAVRAMVVALPEVAEARVTLRPSWMRTLPEDPDRVEIVVE